MERQKRNKIRQSTFLLPIVLFFTRLRNSIPDGERFFQETRVPVLIWEGKCLRRRAKPAHFGRHLPSGPGVCADQKRRRALLPRQSAVTARERFGHTRDEMGG